MVITGQYAVDGALQGTSNSCAVDDPTAAGDTSDLGRAVRVVMSAAACASSTDHQKLDNALGKSPTSTSPSADKRVCIDCPAITVFYRPVRSPLLLLASPLAYMYM